MTTDSGNQEDNDPSKSTKCKHITKRPLSGVCQPCRKAKVRCDRQLPCARCLRLDLPCRPQSRGKGRPPADEGKGPAYWKKMLEVQRAIYISGVIRNPFAIDMFIRCATEMWVSAFNKLKMNGNLDANKATVLLRAFGQRVLRYGDDSSRSALELMSSLMQSDWQRDLFTPEEVKIIKLAAERGEPSYNLIEGRFRQLVSEWSEDGTAWSFCIAGKGQARITCNEKYMKTFLSGPEEIDRVNEMHLLPAFFWGRVVSPEDQANFYSMVCNVACAAGMDHEFEQMAKCVDKDGTEFSARIRYRGLFLEKGKDVLVAFSVAPLEPQEEEEEEENEAVAGDAFQLIPTSDLVHEGGPVDHGEEEKDEEEGISSTDEEPSVHEEVKPSAVIKQPPAEEQPSLPLIQEGQAQHPTPVSQAPRTSAAPALTPQPPPLASSSSSSLPSSYYNYGQHHNNVNPPPPPHFHVQKQQQLPPIPLPPYNHQYQFAQQQQFQYPVQFTGQQSMPRKGGISVLPPTSSSSPSSSSSSKSACSSESDHKRQRTTGPVLQATPPGSTPSAFPPACSHYTSKSSRPPFPPPSMPLQPSYKFEAAPRPPYQGPLPPSLQPTSMAFLPPSQPPPLPFPPSTTSNVPSSGPTPMYGVGMNTQGTQMWNMPFVSPGPPQPYLQPPPLLAPPIPQQQQPPPQHGDPFGWEEERSLLQPFSFDG